MLIGARALQGLGAGGLMALVQVCIAVMVPPRERGRYSGYLGAVFAVATVGGPLLGGLLVAAGLALNVIFFILAGLALLGVILTLLVPTRRTHDLHSTPIEPSEAADPGVGQAPRITPSA
jgi:MFS family permease